MVCMTKQIFIFCLAVIGIAIALIEITLVTSIVHACLKDMGDLGCTGISGLGEMFMVLVLTPFLVIGTVVYLKKYTTLKMGQVFAVGILLLPIIYGPIYFVEQIQDAVTSQHKVEVDDSSYEITGPYSNEKYEFASQRLGFSLEYARSHGVLQLETTQAQKYENNSPVTLPATVQNSRYAFEGREGVLFYIQGPAFEYPSEGLSIDALYDDCAMEANGCSEQRNAHGVEYYYYDSYPFIAGELHIALIPLRAATLVVTLPRTDNSETPSSFAEEQEFFELLESIRVLE